MVLSALDGFLAGDFALIAHPSLQEAFGNSRLKFRIDSVRIYEDTAKGIRYTCYLLGVPEGLPPVKVMISEVKGFYSILLMTLYHYGEHKAGETDPEYNKGLGSMISQTGGRVPDMILLQDGRDQVRWMHDGSAVSGLALHIDDRSIEEATLREYSTEDTANGIDRAVLVCHGKMEACDIEMWVGFYIMDHNIELLELQPEE